MAEVAKDKLKFAGAQAADAATEARANTEAGIAGAKQDVRAAIEEGKDAARKTNE